MKDKNETLKEAESRFRERRIEAYRVTEEEFFEEIQLKIRLGRITEEDAARADSWEYPPELVHRAPRWCWVRMLQKLKRRPRRIEAAIWSVEPEEILCGLVAGRVSNGRLMATIHYLESNPELETPLSGVIAQIAIRYLELQAFALGCQIIGIANPVPGLVNFYHDLGFTRQITKGSKIVRLERGLDDHKAKWDIE